MKLIVCFHSLFIILLSVIQVSVCDSAHNCVLLNDTEYKRHLLKRLLPLQGQKFKVDHGGFSYIVTICSDVSKNYSNSSVTEGKPGTNATVLGWHNETDVSGGESWLLLTYGNGMPDVNDASCNTSRRSSIMLTCREDAEEMLAFAGDRTLAIFGVLELATESSTQMPQVESPSLQFLEYNKSWNPSGCYFLFGLETSVLCKTKLEGLSNGSVFCIMFLTAFGLYLAIGIAYRRLVSGAKGFEQIPHHEFWRELGSLQADGCNFVCRCSSSMMQREESWRRLTNNFNDGHDDRDDALLRP